MRNKRTAGSARYADGISSPGEKHRFILILPHHIHATEPSPNGETAMALGPTTELGSGTRQLRTLHDREDIRRPMRCILTYSMSLALCLLAAPRAPRT
jgi:hypothetical protein